jgi:choline kinase
MVLAAGAARQLRPDTDQIPATLLEVADQVTLLDRTLTQLSACGLTEIVIVTGHGSAAVADLMTDLERRHGMSLDLVHNDRAAEWGDAYSLWLAREYFGRGVMLIDGDVLLPAEVPTALLAAAEADGHADMIIAADQSATAERDTKIVLDPGGLLIRIGRKVDPADADGRFLGATVIKPVAAILLADALEATWRRDPARSYEDGYQELVDRGGSVIVAQAAAANWVQVIDHTDLQRARELAGRD